MITVHYREMLEHIQGLKPHLEELAEAIDRFDDAFADAVAALGTTSVADCAARYAEEHLQSHGRDVFVRSENAMHAGLLAAREWESADGQMTGTARVDVPVSAPHARKAV